MRVDFKFTSIMRGHYEQGRIQREVKKEGRRWAGKIETGDRKSRRQEERRRRVTQAANIF